MNPGGLGALRTAETGAMNEIEKRQNEVVQRIDVREGAVEEQTDASIKAQIQEYKTRRDGILHSLTELKKRLSSIPDVPQAAQVRKAIEVQIVKMQEALQHIQKAIEYAKRYREMQLQKVREQFARQKEQVTTAFKEQKAQILMRFAEKKIAMKEALSMYQARRGVEGGNKAKG